MLEHVTMFLMLWFINSELCIYVQTIIILTANNLNFQILKIVHS